MIQIETICKGCKDEQTLNLTPEEFRVKVRIYKGTNFTSIMCRLCGQYLSIKGGESCEQNDTGLKKTG